MDKKIVQAAVSCVVFNRNPAVNAAQALKIYLIKREKYPAEGLYSFPGGRIEFGETFQEAAVREFREECGWDVELLDAKDPFHAVNSLYKDRQFIVVQALGYLKSDERHESEDLEGRWFTHEEINKELEASKCVPDLHYITAKAFDKYI